MPQTDPLTLSAWILTQQHRSPNARGRLTVLLNAIGVGCKFVSAAVRRVRAAAACRARSSQRVGAGVAPGLAAWSVLAGAAQAPAAAMPACHSRLLRSSPCLPCAQAGLAGMMGMAGSENVQARGLGQAGGAGSMGWAGLGERC